MSEFILSMNKFTLKADHYAMQRNREQRNLIRDLRKRLQKECLEYPRDSFTAIPEPKWPAARGNEPRPNRVFRSRNFLVQLFFDPIADRLSIYRTEIDNEGRFKADISWEELQEIKDQVGFRDRDAVEIYPAAKDVVNVANMRHLWIPHAGVPFVWRVKDETFPVVGKLSKDPAAEFLGTKFMKFDAVCGIGGLCKVNGNRIDILAVVASDIGKGQFREFIRQLKESYTEISVWDVWDNPRLDLRAFLKRYGFVRDERLDDLNEKRLEVWDWKKSSK